MKFRSAFRCAAALCALAPLVAVPALAGDGNQVYILQDSSSSGAGNTLHVDQSAATDSKVGGFAYVTPLDSTPLGEATGSNAYPRQLISGNSGLSDFAVQSGGNNKADITVSGTGGIVALKQSNPLAGTQNDTTVNLTGDNSFAGVMQQGLGNTATLTVNGASAAGGILQNGNGNTGTVTVSSYGGSGLLVQNGSNNTNDLNVTAASPSRVTYVVTGSNIAGTAPASIVTNAASVTITQTSAFTPVSP